MLIQNPKQFLNVVLKEIQLQFSTELEYRLQIISWVISDMVFPVILTVIWSSAASSAGAKFTTSDIVSYFLMIAIVLKLTEDVSHKYVGNKIIFGEFSNYLSKPFNYLAEVLGISISMKILRTIIALPMIILVFTMFNQYISYEINNTSIILFILALILAFSINFLLGNIFALLSFFVKQIQGLRAFYDNIVTFLSGQVMPIFAIPTGAVFIIILLPFRYTLSFPVEILIGNLSDIDIRNGFIISIIWLLLLIVIYKFMYRQAIKSYEAEGI
ncbi:MAG TPA: ABC-2 family transporter protein [Candidatus Dojkabacteria bacterium]|nr:ABC-2 family transporter protein [Candidatus Dojkabacteria bacterium]